MKVVILKNGTSVTVSSKDDLLPVIREHLGDDFAETVDECMWSGSDIEDIETARHLLGDVEEQTFVLGDLARTLCTQIKNAVEDALDRYNKDHTDDYHSLSEMLSELDRRLRNIL